MRILTFGISGTISGGIESFLLVMNKHMSDDCIFDYLVMGEECIHREMIENRGGKILFVTSYRRNPLRHFADMTRVIKNARKEHKIAYFNLFSMVHILPILMCKIAGYRIVLHAHNNNIAQKNGLYRMLHNISRFLFGGMKCVRFTNSDASTVFMFGKGIHRTAHMIYNAIDTDRFRYDPEIRKLVRNQFKIDDKFVVGFSGRIAKQKNPLFLIGIFEQIHKKEPDSVLLMAGDGNLRSAAEELIAQRELTDSVIMLGVRSDIENIYQAMDAYLLPSLFEGLGIVLIEAQASGLPCVTSANVVPKEAQISGKYLTYISLQESTEKWADAVLQSAKVKHDRITWNEAVKKSRFNIMTEAPRLERLLKDTLDDKTVRAGER